MQDFKQLRVWDNAHRLALAVYRATAAFPKSEMYGLTSQIRRACVSIPSNIAEGCGRDSDGDFARFLRIAQGSANEVEYQLLLASELMYIEPVTYRDLTGQIVQVKRMLNALTQRVDPRTTRIRKSKPTAKS